MNRRCASELCEIGPSLSGRGFIVERIHYAAGYRREPHAHDTPGITLVLDGHLRERVRGVEEDSSALSVVVKPAGTVHENEVGPRGARTIALTILDSEAFLDDVRDLGTWRWSHPGSGVQALLALGRALRHPSSAPNPEEMVLELLGEVTSVPASRPGDAPSWIRRARETLDDLAPDGISVRALADSLRVHPVSLTRAFRRAYGVPVTRYRRLVRIRRAAEQLAGTEQSLSAVAQQAGYADQPHMCREIRLATGLAPAVLRALARS